MADDGEAPRTVDDDVEAADAVDNAVSEPVGGGGAGGARTSQSSSSAVKTREKPRLGRFFVLFEAKDRWIFALAAVSAILGGARFPVMSLWVGDSMDSLGTATSGFEELINPIIIKMVLLGVVSGFCKSTCEISIAMLQARISSKYQAAFLDTLLRKDSSWYDVQNSTVLLSEMTTGVYKVMDLYGTDCGTAMTGVSAFIISAIVAVSRSWQLGLIMVGFVPISICCTMFGFRCFMRLMRIKSSVVGVGALTLEQCISGVRTVAAFGLEEEAVKQVDPWIKIAPLATMVTLLMAASSFSLKMGTDWFGSALMYYVGARFVIDGSHNDMTGETWLPGDIFAVWFTMFLGVSQLAMATSYAQHFADGLEAMNMLSRYRDGQHEEIEGSARDLLADEVAAIGQIEHVEFRNVCFTYPGRPDVKVLKDVSFRVQKGQKLAVCGESGSGKSTIIQLLMRFYDPEGGAVFVNGKDIRDYHVSALRRAVSLVEQEPVLFATTLRKNLQAAVSITGEVLTDEQLRAVKEKCLMQFVDKLPQTFDTYCGAKGTAFSGGQKQRACIARALLRNPQLLLLDEATAALDNKSEREIQVTLDKVIGDAGASVTVAHRLRTIKDSDAILVFKSGEIVEQGTHDELMALEERGMYSSLVKLQEIAEQSGGDELVAQISASMSGVNDHRTQSSQGKKDAQALQDLSRITPRKFFVIVPRWYRLAFRYSKLNFFGILVGQLGQICTSGLNPFYALVLIKMLTGLYAEGDEREDNVRNSTLSLVALGLAIMISLFLRMFVGFNAQARNVSYLRLDLVRSAMCQDLAFFDNPGCTAPQVALTFSATLDPSANMILDSVCGVMMEVVGGFTIAMVLAFTAQPALSALVIITWPVNIVSMYLEFRAMIKKFVRGKDAHSESASAQIFHDCTSHLKTVRATQCEDAMMKEFTELVALEGFKGRKELIVVALIKGVAYSFELCHYAFAFWMAAKLMDSGEKFDECMQAMMTIIIGLTPVAAKMLMPFDGMDRKLEACGKVLDLLDHKPTIHSKQFEDHAGRVEALDLFGKTLFFENVRFRYAQRPEVEVLRGMNFDIQLGAGQMVGLCGPSGGGKSSILSLLLRFYDPVSGTVRVDGLGEVRSLDVRRWRKSIAYVAQEPTLFQDSLLNNVRYGNFDATPEDVSRAIKMAHVDFVDGSPSFVAGTPIARTRIVLQGDLKNLGWTEEKFDRMMDRVVVRSKDSADSSAPRTPSKTLVWHETVKMSSLSGGQRQRVAIARALVRKAPILIFDEATSALDSHSEKIVQDSIAESRTGQTQFVVAHRLSTISAADKILVVALGVVVEAGTSEELLQKRGVYYGLVKSQR